MIINGYNLSTEVASFMLAILVLFLMYYTKPRKTKIYFFDFLGFICSVVLILLLECILLQTRHYSGFNPFVFNLTCFIYYVVYITILALVFMYITQISSNKEELKPLIKKLTLTIYTIFCVISFYLCFVEKMYYIAPDGHIFLSTYFYTNMIFGIIVTLITLTITILNRKNIYRIFYFFICLFSIVELVLLVMQLFQRDIFFFSLTYVLPFTMFYLLFHSNPYDENNGSQNAHSFETRFTENVRYHRKYMIVYVTFPTLKNENHTFTDEEVERTISNVSRRAENICKDIHIYAMNNTSYSLFINIKNRESALQLFEKLHGLLDEPFIVHGQSINILYNMVGFFDTDYVKNITQLKSMVHFLFEKIEPNTKYYFCKEADYEEFSQRYLIYKMLIDIHHKKDLDDERVLCFTQPIYDIQTKTFRTAEALMRLSLDGKTIYPDQFIELAESNNCIHSLTCIILNKVCKNIILLEKEYDFDAITVNCSTTEFTNRNLHAELLQIILANNVLPSKIRLELTESTVSGDYDSLIYNMNKLKEAGVQFYLDDFGTGYSNLERIISCPFSTIKFDKSILYKAVKDQNLNDIVVSMAHVFKHQGFILLMEGVEDDIHRDYTIANGFDNIQGYKYAKPVPALELKEYFTKKTSNS